MAVSGGYLTGHPLGGRHGGGKLLYSSLYNERQYKERVVRYEKEFNINISRINAEERELRDSMLAYTNHVKTLRERQFEKGGDPPAGTLQIRARNIPKVKYLPKLEQSPKVATKRITIDTESMLIVKESLTKRLEKFNAISRTHTIPPLGDASTPPPSRSPIKEHPVKVGLASEVDLEDIKESFESKPHAPSKKYHSLQPGLKKSSSVKLKGGSREVSTTRNKVLKPSQSTSERSELSPSSTVSTVDTKTLIGGFDISKKREEVTRRILKDAILKLKDLENRTRDPAKMIARLKANKMRHRRLKFQKQQLDVIPEDEDDVRSGKDSESERTSRFSLSRERHIEQIEPRFKATIDEGFNEKGTEHEFVPDTSLFPARQRVLPPLAPKPAPYQSYLGKDESGRKLQARAKQRQKARKLKFLKGD